MKYLKLKFLIWWVGVFLIVMGGLFGIDQGYDVGGIVEVFCVWMGNVGLSVLIV